MWYDATRRPHARLPRLDRTSIGLLYSTRVLVHARTDFSRRRVTFHMSSHGRVNNITGGSIIPPDEGHQMQRRVRDAEKVHRRVNLVFRFSARCKLIIGASARASPTLPLEPTRAKMAAENMFSSRKEAVNHLKTVVLEASGQGWSDCVHRGANRSE